MKRVALIVCLALAGCQNATPATQPTTAPTQNTAQLLAQDSNQVCTQADVREGVLSKVKPKLQPNEYLNGADIENGLSAVSATLDTIALAAIDKDVHSVTCEANLTVHVRDTADRTFPIRYVVKPSLEDPTSFIFNATTSEAEAYATSSASSAANVAAQQRTAAQQAAAPAPTATPSADPTAQSILPDQPASDQATTNTM